MMTTTRSTPDHNEAYYRDLCEHLGVALIATDKDLNIHTFNAAAVRMFGASRERMIGAKAITVFPPERRDSAERMMRRAIDTGETGDLEFDHRSVAGLRQELIATVAPVTTETGVCVGASICIRDITRRIALQTQLLESRKMASLGQMAGAIAHHFNNILGGVVTGIDYAAASDYDPALTKRVLDQANRAIMRATAMVNGLLAFAEDGPRPDDLSDLTEVLNELAHETEAMIGTSGIVFEMNVETLPILAVPRVQLSTVLRNIVQNAIEAMPKGGTLTINAVLNDPTIDITIRDTGKGLDEADQARIFEPFWTTKHGLGEGSVAGLGLAIAHGLVHVLGGSVTVSSAPDRGSTFTVSIPLPKTTP